MSRHVFDALNLHTCQFFPSLQLSYNLWQDEPQFSCNRVPSSHVCSSGSRQKGTRHLECLPLTCQVGRLDAFSRIHVLTFHEVLEASFERKRISVFFVNK